MPSPENGPETDPGLANTVHLRGRLAAPPELRSLPSGDELVTWRVVVPRAERDIRPRADGKRGVGVDTLDCMAWTKAMCRRVQTWCQDDLVEVDGALQRRYFRYNGTLISRHEVVVRRAKRLARAPTSTASARG